MKRMVLFFTVAALLMFSSFACCIMPRVPRVQINVPTIEVGEMQETSEEVSLDGVDSATVEILFGAGELEISAGEPDLLFSGQFRYNVEQWKPDVDYRDGRLRIKQGGDDDKWGVATGGVHNEWELEFSPDVPLDVEIKLGAGEGKLDFTGLQIKSLDMDLGAGDFDVRFDEPNEVRMRTLSLDAGASKLDVRGVGNAGPEQLTVKGGVGDLTLDLTGDWPHSADVDITAGVGSLTLRLPDNVGVRVKVDGMSAISAPDFERSGDAYVNDAYGEAEIELRIRITTGVGQINLIEVSND